MNPIQGEDLMITENRRCQLTVRRWAYFTGLALTLGLIFVALDRSRVLADEPLQYNRDIRPLLAEYCFACHGADSAARQADLRLDRRDDAIGKGAIVPGKPHDSTLIERIFSDDLEQVMPPPESKKSLSAEEKNRLQQWIIQEANYQPHWALLAPSKPVPPEVTDETWSGNPIDKFVFQELENRGLTPAPAADPRTLFRRLHLDITGLPPSPADTLTFETEFRRQPAIALENWIDRLMSLPSWGEHHGRYWLDAARYADTHGMHFDNYREMWPYRDWVIRSFNSNQPFDQFVIEQLAGDLLPNPTKDQLIATGFQRCNITTNEGGTIEEENLALYATDRVQTFGWVFLGLTTNCCQCHDHKFDPLSMKDYYSLAAFFRNTSQSGLDGNSKDGSASILVLPSEMDLPRWDHLPNEIAAAKSALEEHKISAKEQFETWLTGLTIENVNSEISSEGLAVHAKLNEGTGDQVSNQGSGPAAFSVVGKPQWHPEGKFGPAPMMNQDSTFIVGEPGDWDLDQSFSYGAWVNSANRQTNGAIIARMDDQTAHRGWDLLKIGGSFAVHLVDHWPDNALKVKTRGDAQQENQWQHVFVTYDGSRKPEGIKIFVDGKAESLQVENKTIKPDASIKTATPTRIGQRSEQQIFSGGMIQELRLYDRALTVEEVAAIAKVGLLSAYLTLPEPQRTPEQKQSVFEFYLQSIDPLYPKLVAQISTLEAEYAAIKNRSPITHIQQERADSEPLADILIRGEYDKKGEQVHAATPAALHPLPVGQPNNRLGLAHWVVDSHNPLTARVTVNRFWQHIFGQGLVTTAEDFGVMGSAPSHPELLDWLAVDFREHGWDVKRFHKMIFTSATYRQAAAVTAEKLELDRSNTWFSRGPRFRMDAEMIRDLALQASGLLSAKMYGPGVKPYQPENIWDVVGLPEGNTRKYEQDTGENLYRRTLYSFWKRMAPPPNMDIFNAPSREVCSVKRERTNTPLQALVVLNDPLFVESARMLAETALLAERGDDLHALEIIAQRVLNRSLTSVESDLVLADLAAYLAHYREHPADANELIKVGSSVSSDKLEPSELAAWTMVCNQLFNLDETINK